MNKEAAISILNTLHVVGYGALFAGGAVRDTLLGRQPHDWDIATTATPQQVLEIFPHSVIDGVENGVVKVIFGKDTVDVATLRRDGNYSDGRTPDSVEFTDSFEEDSRRRDFTVNAMFMGADGVIKDFHNGQEDLRRGLIRCVGNPLDRFAEDKLRILRAVRFGAQLGFRLHWNLRDSALYHSPDLLQVSFERISDEFYKILAVPEVQSFRSAINMLDSMGVVEQVLPELKATQGCKQDAYHHPEGDVWVHSLGVACTLKERKASPDLVFAGLLHDIGKVKRQQFWTDKEGRARISNKGHDIVGASLSTLICDRFRLTNIQKKKITELVRLHMTMHDGRNFRRETLIKYLRHENILDMVELQHADGTNSAYADKTLLTFYTDALQNLGPAISSKPLLRGQDLLDAGIPQSSQFGEILAFVRNLQDAAEVHTKEQALAEVFKTFT